MDRFEDAAREFLLSSPFADEDDEAMVGPLAAEFRKWFEAGRAQASEDA